MKTLFVIIAVIALLSFSVIAEFNTYKTPLVSSHVYGQGGVQRVTNYDPRVNFAHIKTMVYLSPPGPEQFKGAGRGGYAPMYPRGTAYIQSTPWYGNPLAKVDVNTKDLTPSANFDGHFEVWLVDTDTGYRSTVGTFTTAFGGVGELRYKTQNYFDAYDIVEITAEPFDDVDISPGPVVLQGIIPAPVYFNPDAKSAKMVIPPALVTY